MAHNNQTLEFNLHEELKAISYNLSTYEYDTLIRWIEKYVPKNQIRGSSSTQEFLEDTGTSRAAPRFLHSMNDPEYRSRFIEVYISILRSRIREQNRQLHLQEQNRQAKVPRSAHFVLLLIPKRSREHLVGDLEEEFQTVVLPRHGHFLARCWYFEQVTLAIGFYLWPIIKKILGLSVLYRLIGR